METEEAANGQRSRWEYRTKYFWNANDRERAAIDILLESWGHEGWELVTASCDADGYTYLIFKRPFIQ
jgi:hypothetical protein